MKLLAMSLAMSLAVSLAVSACSTAGGIYKKDDPEHGEFSMEKTVLTVLGAIAAAAVASSNSGSDYDYNQYQPEASATPWFTNSAVATASNESEGQCEDNSC